MGTGADSFQDKSCRTVPLREGLGGSLPLSLGMVATDLSQFQAGGF